MLQPWLTTFGVTRVADVTWLDDLGIPVFQAIRPMSRSLALSQGKGITADLARISAIMETLEGRAAETVPIAHQRVSALDLDLPYDVGLLARDGYADLARTALQDWCPAVDVRTGEATVLPSAYVSLDWTLKDRWSPSLYASTSNGLASGNTLAEAVLHGLLEVVERATPDDAETDPYIELASITAPYARGLLETIAASDSTIHVRYQANDWGIPVFAASLRNPAYPRFFGGYGAHLDPDVALCRAITEAAQSRATHIAGSRDDMGAGAYLFAHFGPAQAPPEETMTYAEVLARCPSETTGDIVGDLDRVLAALGDEPVLMTDLSLAPGIHVAKVVTPTLADPQGH